MVRLADIGIGAAAIVGGAAKAATSAVRDGIQAMTHEPAAPPATMHSVEEHPWVQQTATHLADTRAHADAVERGLAEIEHQIEVETPTRLPWIGGAKKRIATEASQSARTTALGIGTFRPTSGGAPVFPNLRHWNESSTGRSALNQAKVGVDQLKSYSNKLVEHATTLESQLTSLREDLAYAGEWHDRIGSAAQARTWLVELTNIGPDLDRRGALQLETLLRGRWNSSLALGDRDLTYSAHHLLDHLESSDPTHKLDLAPMEDVFHGVDAMNRYTSRRDIQRRVRELTWQSLDSGLHKDNTIELHALVHGIPESERPIGGISGAIRSSIARSHPLDRGLYLDQGDSVWDFMRAAEIGVTGISGEVTEGVRTKLSLGQRQALTKLDPHDLFEMYSRGLEKSWKDGNGRNTNLAATFERSAEAATTVAAAATNESERSVLTRIEEILSNNAARLRGNLHDGYSNYVDFGELGELTASLAAYRTIREFSAMPVEAAPAQPAKEKVFW